MLYKSQSDLEAIAHIDREACNDCLPQMRVLADRSKWYSIDAYCITVECSWMRKHQVKQTKVQSLKHQSEMWSIDLKSSESFWNRILSWVFRLFEQSVCLCRQSTLCLQTDWWVVSLLMLISFIAETLMCCWVDSSLFQNLNVSWVYKFDAIHIDQSNFSKMSSLLEAKLHWQSDSFKRWIIEQEITFRPQIIRRATNKKDLNQSWTWTQKKTRSVVKLLSLFHLLLFDFDLHIYSNESWGWVVFIDNDSSFSNVVFRMLRSIELIKQFEYVLLLGLDMLVHIALVVSEKRLEVDCSMLFEKLVLNLEGLVQIFKVKVPIQFT